jgi:predicted AAA+ superfamily ATPase
MNLTREYYDLDEYILRDMVLLIYGPRRSGKTSILTNY